MTVSCLLLNKHGKWTRTQYYQQLVGLPIIELVCTETTCAGGNYDYFWAKKQVVTTSTFLHHFSMNPVATRICKSTIIQYNGPSLCIIPIYMRLISRNFQLQS